MSLDCKIPILSLNFKESFEQLSKQEKLYAYHLYKACWEGLPITMFQISVESPAIFIILQSFFSSFKQIQNIKSKIIEKNNTITEEEINKFIEYSSKFYANVSNYLSFGKKKFIPELPKEKFELILKTSSYYNEHIEKLWERFKELIYNNSPNFTTINLEEKNGKNSYYLGGITEKEIDEVDKILEEKKIDPLNTRLLKTKEGKINVLVGSITEKVEEINEKIILKYGEFNYFLKKINENLEKAKEYAANNIQKKMYDEYIEFFKNGNIEKHKDSQRYWVKDKSPVVEFNIGWIETYKDPKGIRGYYEGWVALTDKEKSKKYNILVQNAEKLLETAPWPKEFEKNKFIAPDFIALDVLCFSSTGCPIGINIPNYLDVQESDGFKNISLSNAYPKFNKNTLQFCKNKDIEIISKYGVMATVVKVAGHELLGHGSGKLLRKNEKNEYNFDFGKLINPLTGKVVDKFYINDQTYESQFKSLGRSMEECRADMTGFFFGFNELVQEIFEIKKEEVDNLIYTMWLIHFRKGILGLPLYNIDNKKWGQAHTQGAFVFTNFILKNQEKDKEIIKVNLSEDEKSFEINVDKDNLMKYGKELIRKILLNLHIWKCTCDVESANEFYEYYSKVDEKFTKIRKICCDNEKPRRIELNHNLIIENDDVKVIEYPETLENVIQSFVDRYGIEINKEIYNCIIKYDDLI